MPAIAVITALKDPPLERAGRPRCSHAWGAARLHPLPLQYLAQHYLPRAIQSCTTQGKSTLAPRQRQAHHCPWHHPAPSGSEGERRGGGAV